MIKDSTSFKIKIKDSDALKDVRIQDLISDLFYGFSGKLVATNYGSFFISHLSYNPDKLLEIGERYLTREKYKALKEEYISYFKLKEQQLLRDIGDIDMSHVLVDRIGETTILKILSDHQDVWNSGFAHAWLCTKDLLDLVNWGEYRQIDGYLTSTRKLHKILEAFET